LGVVLDVNQLDSVRRNYESFTLIFGKVEEKIGMIVMEHISNRRGG
jgi:hypothetical protein